MKERVASGKYQERDALTEVFAGSILYGPLVKTIPELWGGNSSIPHREPALMGK